MPDEVAPSHTAPGAPSHDDPSEPIPGAAPGRLLTPAAARALAEAAARRAAEPARDPHEHGGPAGAEPTRFGDWERNGVAVDF